MITYRINCLECDCTCLVEIDKTWDVNYCPSCGSKIEIDDEEDIIHRDVDFDDIEWDEDEMDLSG